MNANDLTVELKKLAVDNFYEYIRTKALRFLEAGPAEFKKTDALGMPDEMLTAKEISLLTDGCRQVAEYRGLTPEYAFENFGVAAFYQVMNLFHYKVVDRRTTRPGAGIFLDEMHMEHLVTKQKMVLYNLVRY